MVRGVGMPVAAVEELPFLPADFRALVPAECDPAVAHAAPLLADVLAPRMRQAREKLLEIRIPVVGPMKLHGAADEQPALREDTGFIVGREKHMERGGLT